MQARFELVPLPGEPRIQGRGAGDRVRAAPGLPYRGPDAGLGGVRQDLKFGSFDGANSQAICTTFMPSQ